MSVSSDGSDEGANLRYRGDADVSTIESLGADAEHLAQSGEVRARFDDLGQRHAPSRPAPSSDLSIDVHTSLVMATMGQVIPRLAEHRPASTKHRLSERRSVPIDERLVSDFTALLLGRSHDAVAEYVDALRRSGVAPSDILMKLIGPAARQLHQLWRMDECSFLDETVAQGRLRVLVQGLADPLEAEHGRDHGEDQALVLTLCGDRFSVDAPLQAVLLEAGGWNVLRMEGMPVDTAERLLRKGTVRCVSIIVMRRELVPALYGAVDRIRTASPDNRLFMIIGGDAVCDCDPDAFGADALAADAVDAVRLARPLRMTA